MKVLMYTIATLFATSILAQSHSSSLTGSIVFVDPRGTLIEEEAVSAEFDNTTGFGISYSQRLGSALSFELGAARFSSDLVVSARFEHNDLELTIGELEMTPLTASIRYHFLRNGRISPYVGGGAGYVLYDDMTLTDEETGETATITFDESVGGLLQGGADFVVTPSIAINVDAKYLKATSDATAEGEPAEEIDIDPLMTSIGISFRF